MFQTCFVWLGRELGNEQTMKGTNSKHMGLWFAFSLFLKYIEAQGQADRPPQISSWCFVKKLRA